MNIKEWDFIQGNLQSQKSMVNGGTGQNALYYAKPMKLINEKWEFIQGNLSVKEINSEYIAGLTGQNALLQAT